MDNYFYPFIIELCHTLRDSHYPLTTMAMEGWVKCLSPQNTFGVQGLNSVAAKSDTIEVNGDQLTKLKKQQQINIKCFHTAPVVSSKCHLHRVFSLNVFLLNLDLASSLFTPETSKGFCGLKHVTHPSDSGELIMSIFSFLDELFL